MQREDLEIIDGQQRINSLYEFKEGAFKVFDPIKDDREARFPNFIKAMPCPWAELEIHHHNAHSHGGPTTLENGRAVHRRCHPRGAGPIT